MLKKIYLVILSLLLFCTSCNNTSHKKIDYEIMNCNFRYSFCDLEELKLFEDYFSFDQYVSQNYTAIRYYDRRINEELFYDYNILFVPFRYTYAEKEFEDGALFEGVFIENEKLYVSISVGVNAREYDASLSTMSFTEIYLIKIPKLDISSEDYFLKTYVRGQEGVPSYYYSEV